MKYGRRRAEKPSSQVEKDRFQNGGGWLQTLGGLAILTVIPVLTILCLSPDVHDWVRTSINAHFRSENTIEETKGSDPSALMKQYRLPDSISKIAEISKAEPDLTKTTPTQSSDLSRAILRLHRALQAYPSWKTKDVFRTVNERKSAVKSSPCPFERIDGEQSIVLGDGGQGDVSLVRTLSRCAEAVEQVAGRIRSAY